MVTHRKAFRARWIQTGEECTAWPESRDVMAFARDGEEPFRSLPVADFWRWFERVGAGMLEGGMK